MRSLAPSLTRELTEAAQSPAMDEDRFRLFYNRTARPLRAYLSAGLHNSFLADDFLQETFLRFLQADLPHGMEDEHCKNYLFRIATNLMRDHYRKAKTIRLNEAATVQKAAEQVVPRAAEDIGQTEDVRRIIKELKPRERELLWLAYVEQFSHREIAAMVGAKTESIRSMLARARQSLAALLRTRTGESK